MPNKTPTPVIFLTPSLTLSWVTSLHLTPHTVRQDLGEAGLTFAEVIVGFGVLQMHGFTTLIFSLQAFSSPCPLRGYWVPAQMTEMGMVPIGVRSEVSNLWAASALTRFAECNGLASKGAILERVNLTKNLNQ